MDSCERFRSALVFGAGSLGTLLGAHLATVLPVTLVGRRENMAEIRRRGVRIRRGTSRGVKSFRVARAVEECPRIDAGTLCLVTVKAYAVAAAARTIARAGASKPGCATVFLQNGTGFEAEALEALGKDARIFRAVCHIGANLEAPGFVVDCGGEMLCDSTPDGRAFAELLVRSGLGARVCRDIKREKWKKIAMNCALNPVGTILGLRNNETIISELKPLRASVLAECAAVASALGSPLRADPLLAEFEARASASRNINSMLQDVMAGRRTEIDYLNGFFEKEGPRLGVPCPVNATLASLIRAIQAIEPL